MARLFCPSVSCPICLYANDETFRFCQNCGYFRKHRVRTHTPSDVINLGAIDKRLELLALSNSSSVYEKQKQSLASELSRFLSSLPGCKAIINALPVDVCRFLVFKDSKGKTKVHKDECPNFGLRDKSECSCPLRLAYGTVDSYIGKLRAIFNERGRQGDWNGALRTGNPASDVLVKKYLKAVTAEQLQARVTPKQATPLFIDKLVVLSQSLEKQAQSKPITPSQMYILARDQAFFKTLFFSGDRGSDLGQVKTAEIARFPADDGLLFNHVWGKTLRDGASNLFGLRRHPNPVICPVKAIEDYMAVCERIGVDLREGYLFRPTSHQGNIINKPFLHPAAETRLKVYLKQSRIDEGETLHSFRSGCALTLAFSGSSLADIMSHVGWRNSTSASYYMKLVDVLRAGAPADMLAATSLETSTRSKCYSDYNHLKNFVQAFPRHASASLKRTLSSE